MTMKINNKVLIAFACALITAVFAGVAIHLKREWRERVSAAAYDGAQEAAHAVFMLAGGCGSNGSLPPNEILREALRTDSERSILTRVERMGEFEFAIVFRPEVAAEVPALQARLNRIDLKKLRSKVDCPKIQGVNEGVLKDGESWI